MRHIKDIIAKALQPGDSRFLDGYRGREIEFYQERGRKYPEKLAEIFAAIAERKHSDIIVIGPRGGGKTMVVYDAAGKRFLWDGDDVFGIGGSDAQARNGFAYVRQIIAAEAALQDTLEEELKTCAVGAAGNWFKVAPSSSKQVRGPHPGDPHEGTGWESHGGVLIKDERDEMDDEIAAAADASMGAANPGMVITTSTMHRADGGGIAQMAEEAEARGATVYKFDIFDVSETCTHDCAACPGGQKFAGPLWGAGDEPTQGSLEDWEQYKKQSGYPADEPGYCEGRAKQHIPGHVRMSTIFEAYRRSPNDEVFEVEFCCRSRRGSRPVVDAALLDRCLVEDLFYERGYEAPIATVDWGLVGVCALTLLQRQAENTIAVLDARFEHMAPVEEIVAILDEWRRDYGVYQVTSDASHPYENLRLAQEGFDVHAVAFGTHKERNAGWVKGIVERGQLRIRGKLLSKDTTGEQRQLREFYSTGDETLFKQLRGWKRDKNGKIVKKNDHGPDSLSTAAELFMDSKEWKPEFYGTGSRTSFGLGGIR